MFIWFVGDPEVFLFSSFDMRKNCIIWTYEQWLSENSPDAEERDRKKSMKYVFIANKTKFRQTCKQNAFITIKFFWAKYIISEPLSRHSTMATVMRNSSQERHFKTANSAIAPSNEIVLFTCFKKNLFLPMEWIILFS